MTGATLLIWIHVLILEEYYLDSSCYNIHMATYTTHFYAEYNLLTFSLSLS